MVLSHHPKQLIIYKEGVMFDCVIVPFVNTSPLGNICFLYSQWLLWLDCCSQFLLFFRSWFYGKGISVYCDSRSL